MGTASLTPPLGEPHPHAQRTLGRQGPVLWRRRGVLAGPRGLARAGEVAPGLRKAAWASGPRRGRLAGQHGHLGHRLSGFTLTIPWASQKQGGIE